MERIFLHFHHQQLLNCYQEQVDDGFTEVVLRNPKTNQEKTLVIPSLRRIAKKASTEQPKKVVESVLSFIKALGGCLILWLVFTAASILVFMVIYSRTAIK